MDIKYLIWGMGGFTVISALFIVGVILLTGDSAPGIANGAQNGPQVPAANTPAGVARARVLHGFDVAFWGEGRPFVRVQDRYGGEGTVDLVVHLMFETQHAESGFSDEGGYTMKTADLTAVENTYRLGLVQEYGLFGRAVDKRDALHWYRIAAMSGHGDAQAAKARLEAEGVK